MVDALDRISERTGGVICMHGPGECLGDAVLLCGETIYPYNDVAERSRTSFVPFTECLIHDYQQLPGHDFIKKCAKEGSLDFEKINQCISEPGFDGGIEMLRRSFVHSEHLGVRTSCTIRLAGKSRCIRDGGVWKDCESGSRVEDLVRDIKTESLGEHWGDIHAS